MTEYMGVPGGGAQGFSVLGPSPLALSLFSPGISMVSMVVLVDVTADGSVDEGSDLIDTDEAEAGTGVGIGFFLLVGLAFLGILFVLTSFHSSGIVYKNRD